MTMPDPSPTAPQGASLASPSIKGWSTGSDCKAMTLCFDPSGQACVHQTQNSATYSDEARLQKAPRLLHCQGCCPDKPVNAQDLCELNNSHCCFGFTIHYGNSTHLSGARKHHQDPTTSGFPHGSCSQRCQLMVAISSRIADLQRRATTELLKDVQTLPHEFISFFSLKIFY